MAQLPRKHLLSPAVVAAVPVATPRVLVAVVPVVLSKTTA
jgi:hypothetical protein